MTAPPAGRDSELKRLQRGIEQWRSGNGAVVLLSADAGLGKTRMLDWIQEQCGPSTIRVDCRPPIGSFNVASIQPLQPFGYAIEQLYTQGEEAAKRRLAVNVGMSLLSALPVVGDMIYAVKAIRQDVTEYKRDTAATQAKKLAAVDACVATLVDAAQRQPMALLIDDGHWADSQSVEVVRKLFTAVADVPLLLVWAYNPGVVLRQRLPLETIVAEAANRDALISLAPLTRQAMTDVVRSIDATVHPTEQQLEVLHDRSAGNPGIVAEYIRFLRRSNMIAEDGTINASAFGDVAPRLSDHPATDAILDAVSDDDANILALAAAEGREFTAWMMSELLNTDVLTAIRTIRRLQRSLGFVKSLGMRTRYGVRTTVYEFTNDVAYTFFLHYPEFEERRNIHQRIADILTQQQRNTPLEELRQQIAPFIAAHSSEAEDETTAKAMLDVAAATATLMGADDIAAIIRAQIRTTATATSANLTDGADQLEQPDLPESSSHTLRAIANALLQGNAAEARLRATEALQRPTLTVSERVTLLCLLSRACVEQGALADASASLDAAERLGSLPGADRVNILNQRAIVSMHLGDSDAARSALMQAASLAMDQAPATRLLTMANIVLLLRQSGDPQAERFARQLRRMTKTNGWHDLRADLAL